MIYFSSDHHFGHEKIIEYCNRPFKNTAKMDSCIIRRHNEIVRKDDITYFIGDLCIKGSLYKGYLENIVKKMNGHKILILGNHDKLYPIDYINIGFDSVHTSLEVDNFILNHDPSIACTLNNQSLICGHVHNLFKSYKNIVNVGVDIWDFYPVSLLKVETEILYAKYNIK